MRENIIITGASSGLGKDLGKRFLKEKFNVINISRRECKYFDTFKCNLNNYDKVFEVIKKIKKKYKKINFVISCTGKSNFGASKSEIRWNKSIQDNLFSVVFTFEIFLKLFGAYNKKFVVISSIAGNRVLLDAPIEYSVAKSALNHYGRIAAKKISSNNSSLNIISPGNILIKKNNWDKRLKRNKTKTLKYIKKNVPSNNFCKPSEIFDILKMLLNKKNNFVGSNITVDGGQSL